VLIDLERSFELQVGSPQKVLDFGVSLRDLTSDALLKGTDRTADIVSLDVSSLLKQGACRGVHGPGIWGLVRL